MAWVGTASQLIIALGLFNVWLLRTNEKTQWRGGQARNMTEEFAAYGLSPLVMKIVGSLKVGLAVLLLIGFWQPVVTKPAAVAVGFLMLGAVAMHAKIKDPLQKSLPALAMLAMTVIVAINQ
jgi:uncharacterized membrane protein YphA (DoxX/SURF4 family)